MTEHQIIYVEPGASAFVQAVCACGAHLFDVGITNLSIMLSRHIRAVKETHDLVISHGDEEFWARCSCGEELGLPVAPNESFDHFARRWERHVMLGADA